jgi:phosphatidyl-myo-inositol dimannoside synthase
VHALVLSSEFPPGPGGIGTHAHQLALQLVRHGWRVTVATLQEMAEPSAIAAFNAEQPFTIRVFEQRGNPVRKLAHRARVLTRMVRELKPDITIASGERMVWLAGIVHDITRMPFVAMGHAMEFNVQRRWQQWVTRRSYDRAAGIICVSHFTWSHMEARGIKPPRGCVIHNGADENRFKVLPVSEVRAFREAHGFGDAPLLVTVGSVHERKGQEVVIRALPRVLEKIPNAQYAVVGVPYRAEAFGKTARELGVADHVHFLGAVPAHDVVRALNAADVFVMASQHTSAGDFEGYGIAVVEAALCGTPAVVSESSGVTEAVEPGETGLVARLSDPASTADRIIELLADRPELAAMADRARTRALQEKTWAHRGVQYDRFLRDLVEDRVNISRNASH